MGPMTVMVEQMQSHDIPVEAGQGRHILGPQANDGNVIGRK
jgi:hypothetical protein